MPGGSSWCLAAVSWPSLWVAALALHCSGPVVLGVLWLVPEGDTGHLGEGEGFPAVLGACPTFPW